MRRNLLGNINFAWLYVICCWNSCLMPQVIQTEVWPWLFGIFERFLESWLDYPISAGYRSMPLDYEGRVIGNVFSVWGDSVHWEDFHSLNIRRVNFSVVEQTVICKQWYFRNAKLMIVLKFENSFFCKTNKFWDISSGFIANLIGVRIPFVTVCFRTNSCFN